MCCFYSQFQVYICNNTITRKIWFELNLWLLCDTIADTVKRRELSKANHHPSNLSRRLLLLHTSIEAPAVPVLGLFDEFLTVHLL